MMISVSIVTRGNQRPPDSYVLASWVVLEFNMPLTQTRGRYL